MVHVTFFTVAFDASSDCSNPGAPKVVIDITLVSPRENKAEP